MPTKTLDRLVYMDDSGDSASGLVVYGWIEFAPHDWPEVLGAWLEHRRRLWRNYGVPVQKELHMTEYVQGRGRISKKVPDRFMADTGYPLWKNLGRAVALESLETLSSICGLKVGAVYRQATRATGAQARGEVYSTIISKLDAELSETNSLGMVFMDGDGSDTAYRDVHRTLLRGARSVIEDPIYTDSKASQFMQMADHVAWCATASILKIGKQAFAHDWYADYLSPRDPARGPQAV